jgi:hypothetical protein
MSGGFERVNVQLTQRQYRVLLAEANATGLRVGTIVRMLLHDDIATGRASKASRRMANLAVTNYGAERGLDGPNGPEVHS